MRAFSSVDFVDSMKFSWVMNRNLQNFLRVDCAWDAVNDLIVPL